MDAKKFRRLSIISFSVFVAGMVLVCVIFYILNNEGQEGNTGKTFRKTLYANESLFSRLFGSNHTAKTYKKKDAVKRPRVNGDAGMDTSFRVGEWKLKVALNDRGDTLELPMDSIKKLRKTEFVFDFKCVEGWNEITHWGGVKISDFVKHYHLKTAAYLGLETPDKKYYVGIDKASALHPQTILCYEMNGKPLPYNQGAPLRLIIPVKYGIKHLKRIGTFYFSQTRPKDYWAERGYDYYAGL